MNVLIRLLLLYGEVPAGTAAPWRSARGISPDFDPGAQAFIEKALLRYKYWHDEPFRVIDEIRFREARRDRHVLKKEMENRERVAGGGKPQEISAEERDVNGKKHKFEMQYWSENHQILFATAEYLAGQWLPGKIFRPGEAYRSKPQQSYGDLTGRERMARARQRIELWLDDRLRFGFSEWNAPGYYDEHVIALLNLADFAVDRSVRRRAEMVLDLVLFDLARMTINGMFGVAASRSHFKHKNCGWHESVGDLIELLFGARDGIFVSLNAISACAFASSRRYVVPEVLLKIARHRPARWVDRMRSSIDWNEAGEHGIGFSSEPDIMRWWSRASWFSKHVIEATQKLVGKYGLQETKPYQDVLPITRTIAGTASAAKLAGYAAAGPAFPLLIPLLGNPFDQDDEVADAMSVITEGSAYTRASIYSYRNRHAILSSTQNHRVGQLSFQGTHCQASLSMCATVFTSHPSAGGGIDRSIGRPLGAVGGSVAGSTAGGLALGPLGAIGGGIIGAIKGAEAFEKDVALIPSDSDGPDWWTGSVTNPRILQAKGAAILCYKPKSFQLALFGHRFHAWFPQDAFDDIPDELRGSPPSSKDERATRSATHFPFLKPSICNVSTGRWVFGRAGDGYVALFSAQLPHWTHEGDWACKEIMVEAQRNVFIIQIGDAEEFGSYEKFKQQVLGTRIHVNGLNWKFSDFQCSYDVPNGSRLELHYDAGKTRYAGVGWQDDYFPRFDSGYAQVAWQQRRYIIQHGGSSLTHDIGLEQRSTGGHHSRLEHVANLRIYSQNMGLFHTIAPYKGTERDRAIDTLISVLRAGQFDAVGLSEMWHGPDRERIAAALADLYPYWLEGPDELGTARIAAAALGAALGAAAGSVLGLTLAGAIAGTLLGKDLPLGSGLFLLSRHPFTAADLTIYRQCAGEDCGSYKGALHVRIHPKGLPCGVDLFLSHTQNLTPVVGKDDARDALVSQIRHLAAFVQSCRDGRGPAILLGDLNVDGLDQSDPGLLEHLYAEMKPDLDLMPTYKPKGGDPLPKHPNATSERDTSGISSFNDGNSPRAVNDSARFAEAAQRLDYILVWQGSEFDAEYSDSDVVIHQSSDGRDMSDHYGITTRLSSILQRLPDIETDMSVTIWFRKIFCFETTSGPGNDEVRFALRVVKGNGTELKIGGRPLQDLEEGSSRLIDIDPLEIGDPGEFLILVGEAFEIDDLSANDSLGNPVLRLDRWELVVLKGRVQRRTLPRFTGDGCQYALELEIAVK
ncbi:MAG: hypothetical protein EOQ33_29855 [Mesorhizobium sp.]|nr:MAG: hypothetical protein EOQ33_29855 [Mesorhizobium sp.]